MFKFSALLLVAALIASVSAYDFQDSDYNKYLFDELQTIYSDDLLAVRNRRDVAETETADTAGGASKKECSRRDWKKDFNCCNGDKFDHKQHETYMEAKKQCYTEIRGNNADESCDPFDCERMQKLKEQMVCVSECVAKKFELIDEKGELKRDAILKHIQSTITDNKWKMDASEGIVDKCIAEAKETKEKKAAASGADGAAKGCNSCPMEFHYCLWREFTNACPAEQRIDTPKCNRMRERFAKNDRSIIHKHFLHFLHERRHEE